MSKSYTILLIALAIMLACILPVSAVGAFYESKIVPTDNSIKTDGCGSLFIQMMTHHSLISNEFIIQRVDPANVVYTNGARIPNDVAISLTKVGEPTTLKFDHVGGYNDRFAPGLYLISLPDGEGGQPEYALANVVEFQRTDVVFLGHGVSMAGLDVCNPVFTIVNAMYGMIGETSRQVLVSEAWIETVIDEEAWDEVIVDEEEYTIQHEAITHVEHRDAITHQMTIIDVAEWDETVVDVEAWIETVIDEEEYTIQHEAVTHIVSHEAITHEETVIDTPAWDETVIDTPAYTEYRVRGHWDNGWFGKYWDHTSSWSPWSNTPYESWSDIPSGDKQTRNVAAVTHSVHHDAITHQETVIDVAAWDETIIDTPAWVETIPAVTHTVNHDAVTHVVHHEAITHEEMVLDVAEWDETVIDTPAWDEIIPAVTHTITHEAGTHTVEHEAVYETVYDPSGEYIDVTEQLQSVVNNGQKTFVFDNRPQNGGIFDMVNGNLLSPIKDPAYGFVKHVTITYNKGCGSSDITIEAEEYETINLNTGMVVKETN